MKTSVFFKQLLLGVLYVCFAATAQAIPIHLQDNFTADPASAVMFASGGFSATMKEDANFSSVLLVNDPVAIINPNPEVIIAAPDCFLVFDYNFVEGTGNNDDEFGAFIIDAATDNSVGSLFEFFTQSTSSGTVTFDLSSLTGQTIGLQFQLSALPGDVDLNSTVTISNLRLQGPPHIPEPSTWLLFAIGAMGVAIRVLRLRRARKSA